MVSKTAMRDIDALRAEGYDVPPREVVRLNALGLRMERNAQSALALSCAPRVAFLGDVAIFEPTIGANMWYSQAVDAFAVNDDDDIATALRLVSLVTAPDDLPSPADLAAVRKLTEKTLDRLTHYSIRQIESAIDYAVDGCDPATGEVPPPREESAEKESDDDGLLPPGFAPAYGLYHRGLILRIGTGEDLRRMTTPALIAAIERAEIIAAGRHARADNTREFGDYMRALDYVRTNSPRRPATESEAGHG